MATVKGIAGPHRFYSYSFDCNEPAHVHVRSERMVCKFWIKRVALAQNHVCSAQVPNDKQNKIPTVDLRNPAAWK